MKTLLFVGLAVALMCTAAGAANYSYTNTTGGTVYVMQGPSSWAVTGAPGEVVTTLVGAGPDGADAYYRSGASSGQDDSTIAYWNFGWMSPAEGWYACQVYVSNYGGLSHENDGVFGSSNGAWGLDALGQFSSWGGVSQGTPGWGVIADWGTTGGNPGKVWLRNDNDQHRSVAAKWNPWGGYGGLAVSGVRISTDGNFAPVPEPSSFVALLAGLPALALLRRKH